MEQIIDGEKLTIPRHIAIIMDGNGRWAKKRHMPRGYGHKAGAKAVDKLCDDAKALGIEYITVYAFSTENWKRSVEEVKGIMDLLRSYLKTAYDRALKTGMRIRIIGDKSALDEDIIELIDDVEEKTAHFNEINFTIALNYGGRDEIRRAVNKMIDDAKAGKIGEVSEDLISSYLDTADIPDPDLLIRTSGEIRLSNYLIWQLAYTEFYFTDILWPDFSVEHLKAAIKYYNGRDRRFGGVK